MSCVALDTQFKRRLKKSAWEPLKLRMSCQFASQQLILFSPSFVNAKNATGGFMQERVGSELLLSVSNDETGEACISLRQWVTVYQH